MSAVSQLDGIIGRLREIEEQGIRRIAGRELEPPDSDQDRLSLGQDIIALQQFRAKRGAFEDLRGISLRDVLSIPVILVGIVPMLLLDLFLVIYQAVCFPAYGIPKVRRSTYLLLDRVDLPYLNVVEKANCAYCGYANGLASYFREITARTEQYWCPIKHARRIVAAHDLYDSFFEYGDAKSYRMGLERLRTALAEPEEPSRDTGGTTTTASRP